MKHNIAKLKKSEIEWLNCHTCEAHQVSYLSHPNCYFKERPADSPISERIGFLDIESSNLKASFGIVISYCILDNDTDKILEYCITPQEIKNRTFDENLMRQFARDIIQFDRVVVYWGRDRRHDIPFLRTRALKHGTNFPLYKDLSVIDCYDWCKNKLSLHSYRLQTVCNEFGIPAKMHPLTGDIWIRALGGDKESLDYILEHNREDVICLRPVYQRLEPFVRGGKVSI